MSGELVQSRIQRVRLLPPRNVHDVLVYLTELQSLARRLRRPSEVAEDHGEEGVEGLLEGARDCRLDLRREGERRQRRNRARRVRMRMRRMKMRTRMTMTMKRKKTMHRLHAVVAGAGGDAVEGEVDEVGVEREVRAVGDEKLLAGPVQLLI